MGCRDDQPEFFKLREAVDDCGTRKLGSLHELAKADCDAPIRKAVASLDDCQIHLDRFTADPREYPRSKSMVLTQSAWTVTGVATAMAPGPLCWTSPAVLVSTTG